MRAPVPGKIRRKLLVSALLGQVGLGALVQPCVARDTNTTLTSVISGVPAAFTRLVGEQRARVDVYFGGKRVGEATITYKPGSLTFTDPAEVVVLLPGISDRAAVTAALAAPGLATNTDLACSLIADRAACGRLSPRVAGIIFDQDRFRLDVFVNPAHLTVANAGLGGYLGDPLPGVGLIDAVSAVVSGSTRGRDIYSLQNQLIVGDGDRRFRADLSMASGYGLQAEQLVAEIDRPGWRYSAGAFWIPGADLLGRRRAVGIGAATQIDTRRDRDELAGTPLVVFLDARSRVDILREGRVVASATYDAGNQRLDAASLPDGSYQVTLSILEANGRRRSEQRFFSRNRRIAAAGNDQYYAYGGVLATTRRHALISVLDTPFVQFGAARRVTQHLAVEATVLGVGAEAVGELDGFFLASFAQVKLGVLAGSDGTYGGLVHVSSQGNAPLNFDLDLRQVNVGSGSGLTRAGLTDPKEILGADPSSQYFAPRGEFTQASGIASYTLRNAQVLFAGSFRRSRGDPDTYSFGPSLRWDFYRTDRLRATLAGDVAVTGQGRSAFLGVSLQFLGARSSLGAGVGARSTRMSGVRDTALVRNATGSLHFDDVAGGDGDLGVTYDKDSGRELAGATATFHNSLSTVSADVAQGFGEARDTTQYSLGLHTTLTATPGRVTVADGRGAQSAVYIEVSGTAPDQQFEVLVNDAVVGKVSPAKVLRLPLLAYRQYAVRIRPTGGGALRYDDAARELALLPGNVSTLRWKAEPMVANFGRIMTPDGAPVAWAEIAAPGAIGQTDAQGYFAIETTAGATIELHLEHAPPCSIALAAPAPGARVMSLGSLVCGALASQGSPVPASTELR
ncbi:TcfC E-set like domain-containing protein [Novosphingobium tardum]|uniref:TcfC E-set like domain-containing protein n=1 Tax=Novosphingobium tardum TaxID=1538021 RepID=A0ABV8RTC3_9SPHN